MNAKEDYIAYKLEKAQQSVEAAELLIDNGFYADAISKIYYPVFDFLQAKRFEADYDNFPFINEKKIPAQLERAKKLIYLIKNRIQASEND
jgi:hypothetical protein